MTVRQLEVTAYAVVNELEQPATGASAELRYVSGHCGQRWVDHLAERRIVPSNDRYIPRHVKTHFMGDTKTCDGKYVALVDERRRPFGAGQQPPSDVSSCLGAEVRRGDYRDKAKLLNRCQVRRIADLGLEKVRHATHTANTPVPERGQIADGADFNLRFILPDCWQRVGRARAGKYYRWEAELDQGTGPGVVDTQVNHEYAVDAPLATPATVHFQLILQAVHYLDG
jgi:hypothetical protein